MRWAIRNRNGPAFLFAIFWFHGLILISLGAAAASIHEAPANLWPLATAIAAVLKKILALISYALDQLVRSKKALRMYQKKFRSSRSLARIR